MNTGIVRPNWSEDQVALMLKMRGAACSWEPIRLAVCAMGPAQPPSDRAVERKYYRELLRQRQRTAGVLPDVKHWSDDQVKLLLRLDGQGIDHISIKMEVNKLPGIRLTNSRGVANKLVQLKLKAVAASAATDMAAGVLASLNSLPVLAEPVAPFIQGVIEVSYEYARRWAIRNGLCRKKACGLNLNAVNAVRLAARMPKFSLKGAM